MLECLKDIENSKCFSAELNKVGIISNEELTKIHAALDKIKTEFAEGKFPHSPLQDEDIHSAVERRLTEMVGPIGGKVHTGRSRNDQVVTDAKMYIRDVLYPEVLSLLLHLVEVLLVRMEKELDVIMPGYTHLQRAQGIRWSQYLGMWLEYFRSDIERGEYNIKNLSLCPLGSGALAGNAFGIDRKSLAKALGFSDITRNSMHAVSDRDFILDMMYFFTQVSLHMSRISEDLIIYSSSEFKFVTMSDKFSTGSSLMPQKKNPDSLELVRGKSGLVIGSLVSLCTILKGLPSTYNKDLQDDKKILFETHDTVCLCLKVLIGTVESLSVNPQNMTVSDDMLATDVAEFLVRKGVPFRDAHHLSGRVVKLAEDEGVKLGEVTKDKLITISPLLGEINKEWWSVQRSVEERDVTGGSSRRAVQEHITTTRTWLDTKKK